ncbi:transporter substrate-binding domain-containing protein [Niveibacterium umoris]|uniref:Solute-binding protein family 3/N-terminal domain-containing protein n=1 Tax=Niveibacterium umoris TaxID=1193620 RepID=A0A840BP82_9RHOO|nr:hypothetical protein [Niveibacterium umoris]MBB4014443.1 hypothetical protein [Niveibacterium umoris]
MRRQITLLLLAALLSLPARGADIRFPGGDSPDDKRWDFVLEILALALEKAPDRAGPDRIIRLPAQMQARRIAELRAGELEVAVAVDSRDLRKQGVIVIPTPLQRGLLGWRLLMIRPESAPRFASVTSLEQLRPLQLGFIRTFADYPIMRANGLNLVDAGDYSGAFRMLAAGRMDYLSRGVAEIFWELDVQKRNGVTPLQIEPALALHYRADWYFIVNPTRADLAERVTRGLGKAIQDGSYDRSFQRHFAQILASANFERRRIIELSNPDLEQDDSVPTSWWWQPASPAQSADNPPQSAVRKKGGR